MRRPTAALLATLALLVSPALLPTPSAIAAPSASQEGGTISGVVTHSETKERIANALVILQCNSLSETRETMTNANGLYAFRSIPAGTCTVQVLTGKADVSKVTTLPSGAKFRANFSVDPDNDFKRSIRVRAQPVEQRSSVGRSISVEEFRNVPVGRSSRRSFTQVVESSATASRDSAGLSLGGTTSAPEPPNREGYAHVEDNVFLAPLDRPRSTFSIDVDTASYSNVRRFIDNGEMPPPDAVRVEELVNYFDYDYVTPKDDKPFAVNWEIASCPWNEDHLLARIGLETQAIEAERVPPRNLVFLLDVSGSMSDADKLPLLKRAMHLLADGLRPEDRVSIVVYAGAAGMVLPPTGGEDLGEIREAIGRLESGGSTNGAAGIRLAYRLARRAFVPGGINRVILATDGDFNVGTTSDGDLVRLIERKRESGVFLSVLGFGEGNLQDAKMEQLADKGNGNYAYIDSLAEARKVLVEEAGATLVTVAKDVKLQVEFNPAKIAGYRLIGYENRMLADRDFDDDTKDAGEMGAGHTVTALYELIPADGASDAAPDTPRKLRYQSKRALRRGKASKEWMTVAVRYKAPDAKRSKRFEVPMAGRPLPLSRASDDLRFAAAVAAYGMTLRGSEERGDASLSLAQNLAEDALGADRRGHRAGFLKLVRATKKVQRRQRRF